MRDPRKVWYWWVVLAWAGLWGLSVWPMLFITLIQGGDSSLGGMEWAVILIVSAIPVAMLWWVARRWQRYSEARSRPWTAPEVF